MTDMLMPSREIVERIVITGSLKLLTPTSLGNGDADGLLDMPLSRDAAEGVPLLTGTSIAGALRNYLRLRLTGYREKEQRDGMAEQLFGGQRSNDEGSQSPLIVDDARAQQVVAEIRDGVRIEPQTRTAQDKKKFDLELLPAGTMFDLRFELLITRNDTDNRVELLNSLVLALTGFEQQEIHLGARKRRGFGRCVVETWTVRRYHLTDCNALLAWLADDLIDNSTESKFQPVKTTTGTAATALSVATPKTDQRRHFTIQAHFALASPLLIRSETPIPVNTGEYPDITHLYSHRPGNEQTPVLPGTSLAGALRGRALRILNTLNIGQALAQTLLDSIFGSDMNRRPDQNYASRLVVEESVVEAPKGAWLVQQRVSIDRFTGGALDTALFSEAPLTTGGVELRLTLQGKPIDDRTLNYRAEVGLLLLLLKDLWTGDLPLGGTSSIGRGRLHGVSATLCDALAHEPIHWSLVQQGDTLQVQESDPALLELYVKELHTLLHPSQKGGTTGDGTNNRGA